MKCKISRAKSYLGAEVMCSLLHSCSCHGCRRCPLTWLNQRDSSSALHFRCAIKTEQLDRMARVRQPADDWHDSNLLSQCHLKSALAMLTHMLQHCCRQRIICFVAKHALATCVLELEKTDTLRWTWSGFRGACGFQPLIAACLAHGKPNAAAVRWQIHRTCTPAFLKAGDTL